MQKVDAAYPEQFGMWGSWALYFYLQFLVGRQLRSDRRWIGGGRAPSPVPWPLNSAALLAACKLPFNPRLCSQSESSANLKNRQ